MTHQNQSRFALNLATQFFLAFVLTVFTTIVTAEGPKVVLSALSSIAWLTFSFGFFYGLFRAFGLRSGGLEAFYQSFPFSGKGGEASVNTASVPTPVRAPAQPFDWHKLFSFQFLRFAGVLLIITSVFSLLFNIEWELLYKIIAAAVSGLFLLGGAEWLRTKKGAISPFLSIMAFALLQFALSLSYQYATQYTGNELAVTDMWLYFKIGLTIIMLFTMTRYPAAWMPLLYILVGWFSAISLSYVGGIVSPMASAVFIVALSALTLVAAGALKKPELIVANAIIANVQLAWLLLPQMTTVRYLVLILVIGLFAAQLFASVVLSAREKNEAMLHIVNTILSHLFLIVAIQTLRSLFPLMDEYIGVSFLILANVTLLAYLVAKKMQSNLTFADVLFNSAVILASIGLFIQVTGPWSSVIFLAYSTAILWLSLYRQNIRTRAYGCVLLLVSIIKLFFEFGGIFDKVWGCVAILAIGLLLVVLSYKFETVKNVMLHGMNDRKKV